MARRPSAAAFAALSRPWDRPGGEALRATVTPAETGHIDITTTVRYHRRGEQA